MALVNFTLGPAGLPYTGGSNSRSTYTFAISASADKMGVVFQAPIDGVIDKVAWHTGTVTTASTQFDIRLETVNDTTDGFPSGVLANTGGSGSNATVTIEPTTNDDQHQETTLGETYTATRGEFLAIVVQWISGNAQIRGVGGGLSATNHYMTNGIGGTWAFEIGDVWLGGPIYGSTYPYVPNCEQAADGTGAIGDTPSSTLGHRRGAKFRLPFPCRVRGVSGYFLTDTSQNIHLYDSDASTVLGTINLDDATIANPFGGGYMLFDDDIELKANTWYRLANEVTASNVRTYWLDMVSGAEESFFNGGEWYYTEATSTPTGEGDWTDTTSRLVINRNVFLSALPDRVDPYFTRSSNVLLTR